MYPPVHLTEDWTLGEPISAECNSGVSALPHRYGTYCLLVLANPTIVVDAVGLSGRSLENTGTGYFVRELLQGLVVARPQADLRLLVSPRHRSQWKAITSVPLLDQNSADEADVIIRPFQIGIPRDLRRFRGVDAARVLFQFDLIALEENYFASPRDRRVMERVVQQAVQSADVIATLSEESAQSIRCFVPTADDRIRVIPPGVSVQRCQVPTKTEENHSDGFVLVLAASYRHKNRPFALRVFEELRKLGYTGRLVLAGPDPVFGSTLEAERSIAKTAGMNPQTTFLGPVSDAVKVDLLRNCDLVLYPSSKEGFGLVPFEAAAANKACLVGDVSCFREVCGEEFPLMSNFDAVAWAQQAMRWIEDPAAARTTAEMLSRRADIYTWSITAERTWDGVDEALRTKIAGPLRPAKSVRGWKPSAAADTALWEITRIVRAGQRKVLARIQRQPDHGY